MTASPGSSRNRRTTLFVILLGRLLPGCAYVVDIATVRYDLFPYPWVRRIVSREKSSTTAGLKGPALLAALKEGGYTIFFRHARKQHGPKHLESQFPLFDSLAMMTKFSSQHPFLKTLCLNKQGKAEAWAIGVAF